MYNYESKASPNFSVAEAYNQIAGAAFRFESEGHENIWIYLQDNELKFHYTELKPISECFVAHYPCHKLTHGLSEFEWIRLGRNLARVYFSHM